MNIAFMTFSDYPWRSGGVNQFLHSIAAGLAGRGHRVTVYALPNFTGQASPVLDAGAAGVEVVTVPAPLLTLRQIPLVGPVGLLLTLKSWPERVLAHVTSDPAARPDVLVADFTNAAAAVRWEAGQGPPAVVLRWANWASELAESSRVFGTQRANLLAQEEQVLKDARCLCVNGRDIEADLLSRGVEASRIAFVPSTVDTARFSASYDTRDLRERHSLRERVVLFPSMLRDIKGFDHLLRAFAMLPAELRGSTSIVATGRGDSAGYLKLAEELGIADAVVFLGEAPSEDIPRWFALSDVAVFPYLFGAGTSVASIEALAAGLPVVAYRMQAFEHVVDDGVTGILVDGGDVEGLAAALQSVLSDHDRRAAMSRAAREAAAEYDIETVTEHLEGLLVARVRGDQTCG